jgi:hypothetical protein
MSDNAPPLTLAVHPAKEAKCTKAQIEVFERIAVNLPAMCSQKTLDALSSKGLIAFEETQRRDSIGSFVIRTPFVPLPVHYEWCRWCSENVELPDDF